MHTKPLVSRAPRQPGTVAVSIRLTPGELAKADRYGSDEFRSRAAFVRLMYLRGINVYEAERSAAPEQDRKASAQLHAVPIAG